MLEIDALEIDSLISSLGAETVKIIQDFPINKNSKKLVFPMIRNGTTDIQIWESVYSKNEYDIKQVENFTVLDIGAHTGSFSFLCQKMGASRIYSFEPHPYSFKLLSINLSEFKNIRILNKAVIGSIEIKSDLYINYRHNRLGNYGNTQISTEKSQNKIKYTTLDEIIKKIGHVDLIKFDCEGSEFTILLKSNLSKVDQIVGEYHLDKMSIQMAESVLGEKITNSETSPDMSLINALEKYNFKIKLKTSPGNPLGKFWATKK